ncbi:MAG TPA: hypothetical protein VEC39_03520 [Vicinamibacterales bacterium]|nr:hypothetical protein [Vicinamibacterales bacterium]
MNPVLRRVRFELQDLDPVRMMVRSAVDTLTPGTPIDVEVGARWVTRDGHEERVAGHWVRCEVVTDSPRELVVKLLA